MNEDFYAILGVAPTANGAEIERAYRRLARASHPDLLTASVTANGVWHTIGGDGERSSAPTPPRPPRRVLRHRA